jgi:hypothetical protein
MSQRFTIVEDFWSDELQSQYCAGLSYEAQDDNTKLLELLPQWIAAGKAREGGPTVEVTGTGE